MIRLLPVVLGVVVACGGKLSQKPAPVADATKETTVSVDGAQLHVRSAGGSPGSAVLVALHGGWGLSHEYMRGFEALASPALRVVTYDQRAAGRSTGALGPDLAKRNIEDLEALRRWLGVERMHVLGHSAAGVVAMMYAAAHPDRVATLILVDAAPPTAEGFYPALGRLGARAKMLAEKQVITIDESDPSRYIESLLPAYFVDPAHPSARSLGGTTWKPEVFDAMQGALGEWNLKADVARFQMPVFVFVAEVPFGDMGGLVLADLPAERVTKMVVTDCGHIPWLECPEPFFSRLRSFLDQAR